MKLRSLFTALALLIALAIQAKTPRYIFYFIGDGMGVGAASLAQSYNRMVLGQSDPLMMMQFPVTSLAFTHSASSPVTDSAAAGTALASGHKTKNGMLGMDADSVPVTSIAPILHRNGYGVGLVTTVAPDDATPGAFYAHQPHRGMFYEIGCDAAASGFEFIAGANLRGLKDGKGNPTDLLEVFEQNEVSVVRGPEGMKDAKHERILMLGTNTPSDNEIGLSIDSLEGVVTLPQLTSACLGHLLKNSPERFFMMVEGGSIDHAGHANDAATSIHETLAFNDALRIAYNFYLEHPDETLIIVTADHETGGLALANTRLHYNIEPKYLQYVHISKDSFINYCKSLSRSKMVYTWDDMKQLLTDKLGFYTNIPVSEEETAQLKELFDSAMELRNSSDRKELNSIFNKFTNKVYGLVSEVSGIGWTTGDHSGAPVPVFAVGVDADRFSRIQDNTEIPVKILSIAGVEK